MASKVILYSERVDDRAWSVHGNLIHIILCPTRTLGKLFITYNTLSDTCLEVHISWSICGSQTYHHYQ